MKKLSLLLSALCLLSIAYAQPAIGVKAGLNINNVKYKNDNGYTAGVAYQLGLAGWLPVNKKWFIRPELLYSVKGAKFPPAGSSGQGNLYLHYISIPILADFPIARNINMQLGPEFGFMTKASSVMSGHKSNVTDYYQHFQWGLDLGASYAFSSVLGAEIRYHNGFKGLIRGITTDNNGVPTGSAKDGSNRSYQFGLYYRFHQF